MKITSIRLGHATNSSSAHSIILHAMNDPIVDKTLRSDPIEITYDNCCRNDYILRTARDKAIYFLWAVKDEISQSNHEKLQILSFLKKNNLEDVWEQALRLEPEMEMSSPYEINPPAGLDISRLEWLKFLLSDAVTVVGYDDNVTPAHSVLEENGIVIDLEGITHWRKDGDAIIGFNKKNGAKFRASSTPYTKASAPELVDVKITDHCAFKCKFCYQGSSVEGIHAPFERIEEIFDELSQLGVFEVALGGGETTSHPDFAKILRAGHDRNLSMNFTSYGTDWVKNEDVIDALNDIRNIGIGISVHTKRDINKIFKIKETLRERKIYWGIELIAQTVVGATPYETILDLIKICGEHKIPLLLLGYKNVGRGETYKSKDILAEIKSGA